SLFTIDIDFAESVSGLTASDFTVTGGTAGTLSGSGKAYQLTINPLPIALGHSSSTVAVSLLANNASDAATNLNTASNSVSRTFDNIQPTAGVVIGFYNSITATYPTTVTFSEPVTGFDIKADLTLSGLNAANLQGSGTTYTFDLALVGNTNNTIAVNAAAATDDAGNSSIASSTVAVISDIIAPTATMTASAPYVNIANKSGAFFITVTLTDPLPAAGDPISGIAPASFPANLLSTSAVSITYNVGSYNPVAPTSGSTTTNASATYTVVPTSPNGWIDLTGTTIVASLGTSAYTDASGNNGSSDVSVDFKVDVVAPELLSADRTKPVANSEEFNRIDMVFSEPVFNVTNAGFAVLRSTKSATTTTSLGAPLVQAVGTTGESYKVTGITQANTRAGGNYAFTFPAGTTITDEAGNKAVVSSSVGAWDQVDIAARAKITSTLPNLTNNPILPITVSFGRSMKNLTAAGIAVLNENNQNVTGSVLFSAFTRSADGKQYTFTINLGANAPTFTMGKFTILVIDGAAVSDDAEELPCGFSESRVFTIDRIPPTGTLIPWAGQFTDGGNTNRNSIDYKAIFELPVQNVPRSMITVTGGTVTSVFAIAGTNLKEWRVTVKPALNGTSTQNVAAQLSTGIFKDAAGNVNLPSNIVTVAIKRNLAITSTINVGTNQASGYNFAVGKLNNLSVRFNDVVDTSTITAAAFNVAGGTVTNIRPDADSKGAQFDLVFANRPNSQFVMSVAFKAGVVHDLFGNIALSSTAKAWTIDGLAPTATMTAAARIRLGETSKVAVAFSQFMQPLNLNMFDVTFTALNGTTETIDNSVSPALSLRGAGASWSISFKPTKRGTLTVRLKIDADGPKDLLGNALQIPAGFQVVIA
ncbi:MAG: beta strand repeat-containing protein, partial [Planctomycetota bacterium]